MFERTTARWYQLGRSSNMKLLIVVLLNYMSSSTRQCGPAVTLFKKEQELPGPSMLFNASLAQGIFEFTFKTFVEDALVLYQDDEGYSDYIELTLQGGRVYLSFYIKNSRKREFYVSNNKYNDYKWHPVKIERNASCTKIFVDYEVKKTFKTNGLQSRFTSKLQIGGFPPERYSDPNTITRQAALTIFAFPFNKRGFFNACVKNITYGRSEKDLAPIDDISADRLYVYEKCNLTYCNKPEPLCKNGGVCKPTGETTFMCDCRWTGYKGENCTKPSLELRLTGAYQVRYNIGGHASLKKENYTFRMKTNQKHAIIMKALGYRDSKDKIKIEIRNSRLFVTYNNGADDAILETSTGVSDDKWHLIQYQRNETKALLIVDRKEKVENKTKNNGYTKMDYDQHLNIGVSNYRYPFDITLQDFIWEYDGKNVNFVNGLFDLYHGKNNKYMVIPKGALPKFNEKLPPTLSSYPPVAHKTIPEKCFDTGEVTCSSTPATTSHAVSSDASVLATTEEEDDSSVTWIVVVTVICALILFAIIAFLVHKWNKRYSGDFQVEKKEIGPSGTVVQYKDPGYKEKKLQSKV